MIQSRLQSVEDPVPPARLELDHYAETKLGLTSSKIRVPDITGSAAGYGCCCQIVGTRGCARHACEVLRKAIIPARRRHTAAPREIRNVRVAIAGLRPPGDVLFWHVLESNRAIPHVSPLAGIFREVWRTGGRAGSVDRRRGAGGGGGS